MYTLFEVYYKNLFFYYLNSPKMHILSVVGSMPSDLEECNYENTR